MKNNRKSILVIVLLLTIILILLALYFFVFKSEKPRMLELRIVTYSSLCNGSDNSMNSSVLPFFRVFDGEDCIYYPEIRIKRNDHNGQNDGFSFASKVDENKKKNEVEKIFKNASKELMPAIACQENGSDSINISIDTTKVRHFFLVPEKDKRVDGKLYFGDAQKLAAYMEELASEGDLFSDQQKPDAVNIIILDGSATAANEDLVPNKKPDGNEKSDHHGHDDYTDLNDNEAQQDVNPNPKPQPPGNVAITDISVSHSGAINTIEWEAVNAEGASYSVSIECDSDCQEDDTDYHYNQSNITESSIQLNLQNSWNGVKGRTFMVRVTCNVGGRQVSKTVSYKKLFCH